MAKKPFKPVDLHVGDRVRMRRKLLNMSQKKLADAIGLTSQQVQKYESGMNRMGSSRLMQIANALQVPVTFFFVGASGRVNVKGDAYYPSYVSKFLSTADALALAKAFMQIRNAKLRRSIVNVVNEIVGPEA